MLPEIDRQPNSQKPQATGLNKMKANTKIMCHIYPGATIFFKPPPPTHTQEDAHPQALATTQDK